jgi:hypothetical protein
MRTCPTCQYLIDHDAKDCRHCGTNIGAAEAAAAEAAAKRAAEAAAAQQATSPFSTSVMAAIGVGVVIVALVGWLAFRGGSDQPASASARTHVATSVATLPPASTTTLATSTPATTSTPGYTLFGVPNASANVELPAGTQVDPSLDGDFVRAEIGGGAGLGIGSVDELPLGGTAASLLAYMQEEQNVNVGEYDDLLSNLKVVPSLAGPAVSFDYHLEDGAWGHGTMVLINQILVMVQLIGTPGTTFSPAQIAVYNHAVASITAVL